MVLRSKKAGSALVIGVVGALIVALAPASAGLAATQNPIIGDGSVYSADPSLLADGDTLYIHAGRDQAGATTNDFIMNEWQAFSTTDAESGAWQHHPSLMRPETVFDWATPGRAYAGQVVKGVDGRFYWYVPVNEAASTAPDKFGIGVAVSDTPLGPWTDHAGGPIVSQRVLGNDAHNIDPTVLVDNGRVWMYWGSFGRLMATELQADMKTRIGTPTNVTTGVTGFFEAAWLFERNDTYYLAYAANNAGPTSTCTPANYHACIAYSTASSPLGPWTARGRILAPVSSTTSHPAIAEFEGEWYMAYHTADAVGGNHFRRSVAIDKVEWDDTQTPARILPVVTTPERGVNLTPRSNVAPWATSSASNEPIPTQYWIKSLNDEIIRPNPLPPDMWGSWTGTRPAQQWIQYDWDAPVRVDRARIKFWRDAAPGTGNGVSDPSSWVLQYWDAGAWKDVPNPSGYPTSTTAVHTVTFGAVTTSRLRAVLNASPNAANPPQYSALAVEEWEVHAAQPDALAPVTVQTVVGTAPELPETVGLTYGADTVAAPVRWDAIDPADLAAAGEFTVEGFVEGYAGGRATATVTVLGESPWRANLAPEGDAEAESTATGSSVDALNDTEIAYAGDEHPVWMPESDGAATRWAGYTWADPVRVDAVTAHFWSDQADAGAGEGTVVPESWRVQVLVEGDWQDVSGASAYPTERLAPNAVTFDAVVTTGIRAVLTPASTDDGVALSELEVFGETLDGNAPEVALTASGVEGANGWYLSPVTVRATATDDRDVRTRIEVAVDAGAWQATDNVRFVETTVTGDGQHTVKARATDSASNVSEDESVTVRIDSTKPTVTGTLDIAARTVSATAADAGSGAAGIEYAIDSPTGWQAYGSPVPLDEQRHVVYLRSKDAAGNVSTLSTVTVPLSNTAPLVGNIAPIATPTASYTSGWNSVTAVNDGSLTGASWGTWPNVGEQWVQLEWDRVVTVDRAGVLFFRDSTDTSNAGMIPPSAWKLQYVDLASGEWLDVAADAAYGRSSTAINEVTFDAVTTTKLRAVMQAWGTSSGGGSSGILEFEAWAAEAVEEPSPIDVEVVVADRCAASKVVLAVSATNHGDDPVTVALTSAYGSKTVTGLAADKRTSHAFTTRLGAVPAGEVTAVVTAVVDGETETEEYTVEYEAATC
ncbi:family 43 glycosylhydrolase [Microbacterium sp. CFBP9034]|uniref:family 43 glycosylhydrolase n=1 Tax=Microbacterium sp. CFBP9034 TaxID=3096540 RepID=UPI002A6B3D9B|nr:family 43 glycosylhydrolase [Microbacterium sp. CFBP9034]MDY0908477.1 family 43 glycosylhydrolase [Microbacterium sp. CFBP9034]